MKNSSPLLDRSYVLLPFVLVLAAFLACLSAPFIKVLLDRVFDSSFALKRVLSRLLIVYLVLLFILYRKRLKSNVGESLNHTRLPWATHLIWGFLIGVISLALLSMIMLIAKAAEFDVNFSLMESGQKLLKYLGTAAVVAIIEEIVFRGIFLQSLRAELKAFFALMAQ